MSAVRDGPLTNATAGEFAISGDSSADSRVGRISDARSTAIWISGSKEAVNGRPSPPWMTIVPVSAMPANAPVMPALIFSSASPWTEIPAFVK